MLPVDVSVLDCGKGLFELPVRERRTAQSTHPPPIPVPVTMSNLGLVPGLLPASKKAPAPNAPLLPPPDTVSALSSFNFMDGSVLAAFKHSKSDKPVSGIAGIGVAPNADVVTIAANLGGGDQLCRDAGARSCGNAGTQLGRAQAKEDRPPQDLCHAPLMAANNDLVYLIDRNSASPKAIQLRSVAACRAPA